MQLLLVDNYDSFTYNVLHLFGALPDVSVTVRRNDDEFLSSLGSFDGYIIGPGPGSPEDTAYFGACRQLIQRAERPLLGICLGFQGLAVEYGAKLIPANQPMHGKTSHIAVTKPHRLLTRLTDQFEAMRYHSLMIDTQSGLPSELEVLAEVDHTAASVSYNGREIMAITHHERPLYGVQFHPESFATTSGQQLAQNFVDIVRNFK